MDNRTERHPTTPADATLTWREIAGAQRSNRTRFVGRVVRRVVSAVAIVVLSAGAGAVAWTTIRENLDEKRRLTLSHIARSLAETSAQTATRPIATRDAAALRALGEAMLAGKVATSVGFYDARGNLLASVGDDSVGGPRESAAIAAPGGGSLGTVRVTIDAATIAAIQPGERAVLGVSAAAAGMTATLSVMLATAYTRRRLAPMRRLAKAARRARAGATDTLSIDPEDAGCADVAEVREALTWLARSVAEKQAEIASHNARAAEAIRELEAKLDDRANQLTAANERLVGEIAEKEDFVRAISHDLSAPLRNIGGMVTMMLAKQRATLPEDVVHRLERVKANVDHEAGLIDELLEFSRIKTRRQALQLVEVEKLVWELRGLFENDLKTRHIDVVLETSLPNLFAERVRIRQVFQNLIDNAIKYMGDDMGRRREVRVGCRVSVAEAEFYVSDTGIGIDPADQDKVFYIFRRGKSEAAQKVAGKGVGLASVKSIIETYAGRIWVESTPGVGTTFRFTINGQYVPAVSGKVPQEMAGQATQVAPSLSRTSIGSNRAA